MKAAAFAYHRPNTVADAVQMLGEFGDDAKILAGGQSLVPMLAMRLTHFENLIDISRVDELKDIERRDDDVFVGAVTPHALVGMDDEVAESVPLLTLSTPYIGHFQIRTRGTLGGAIAHADPAAEYAAVALALDATMEATSARGRREIQAKDFFTGLWETSLAPDEILTGVRFPVWGGRSGFAVEEFTRRHGVRWRNRRTGVEEKVPLAHLFLFTGADPTTSCLTGCDVPLDQSGFIRTGAEVGSTERVPLPLETGVEGIFAVGDVRCGSVKRVGAAIGEGAAVVAQLHTFLAQRGSTPASTTRAQAPQ